MKKVGLSILYALLLALGISLPTLPAAQASVVNFDVRGHATYAGDNSTQAFTGTLAVDTATGSIESFNLQIPFFLQFEGPSLVTINPIFFLPNYRVGGGYINIVPSPIFGYSIFEVASISLVFTTTNPGSMIGFQGGSIIDGSVYSTGTGIRTDHIDGIAYTNFSGAISAVPELSTWAMIVLGFAGLGLMACRSRPAFI